MNILIEPLNNIIISPIPLSIGSKPGGYEPNWFLGEYEIILIQGIPAGIVGG